MKKEEINKLQNFTKLIHRGGISLIVLVITIIVILILAAAVILTINNNNPVAEANKARYESDRANMQALLTNVVAKVMAKNQGVVEIKRSQINNDTNAGKTAIGEIEYTVINAVNKENNRGKIIFGKGDNTDTIFYTGKELPIYAAGETKWYVDEEGIISLEVAKTLYGTGKQPLDPGLYDENDVMVASWDELVNDYGIDVEADYATEEDMYNYMNSGTMPEAVQKGVHPGGKLLINADLSRGTKLVVGEEVTKIGSAAFVGATTLKEVILPNVINEIGIAAFIMSSNLESINIPKNVTNIANACFFECTKLKSIVIPDSVTNICDYAFYVCNSLEQVRLGKSVISIGEYTFADCNNLTDINLPDSITSIGENAFVGCNISSVKIPSSMSIIGNRAFRSAGIKNIIIPDTVKEIGESAFYNCDFSSVEIPNSVTSIGESAFSECHMLKRIEIPDSIKVINRGSFCICSKLEDVKIPDSVEKIEVGAFGECNSLETIEIPATVTSIEDRAFYLCNNLKSVYFKQTKVPTFGADCFDKGDGKTCTFYFKNKDVYDAFTTEHYNSSFGIKSENFNW